MKRALHHRGFAALRAISCRIPRNAGQGPGYSNPADHRAVRRVTGFRLKSTQTRNDEVRLITVTARLKLTALGEAAPSGLKLILASGFPAHGNSAGMAHRLQCLAVFALFAPCG